MSTIGESAYDLYASYSTAATYGTNLTASVSTLSESADTSFTDMMEAELAEEAVAGADTSVVDDSEDTDAEDGDSDDSVEDSNGTTANDNYYRPDIESDDGPKDELSFSDMLQLMIAQFQNQTIDDTASTTDMMNQLTQMTTMQAMTSMETSITEMTATNAMLYNAQLVGQEVTVAYYDDQGNFIEETGTVAASGYYDGVPVIFFEGQTSFHLVSSIMAIGVLPSEKPEVEGDGDTEDEDLTVDPDVDVDVDTDGSDADVDSTTGTDTDSGTDSDSSDSGSDEVLLTNIDYANMTAEELLAAAASALG